MAKRRKSEDAAPIDEDVVEKIVLLLVTVRSRADVHRYCVTPRGADPKKPAGLELAAGAAARYIDEALSRIRLAATIDHDLELGQAQTRLADLFQKAIKTQDFKTALAIQKELNRLLALYPGKTPAGGSGATSAEDAADNSDALAELAAAREHLAPLVDAGDDESLDEIARRVVALFTSKR